MMDAFVIPKEIEKFAAPNLPGPAKMMTAKGMAPLQPKDMVTSVYAVSLDADENIKKTAIATLKGFPENLLSGAVQAGLLPQVLDGIARNTDHQSIIESIALHKNTHDDTILHLAKTGSTRVIDIIAQNQTRLLRCPKIMDALGENTLTGGAVIDRIFTFLQREGALPPEDDNSPEMSTEEFIKEMGGFDLPEDFEFPEDLAEDFKEQLEEVPEEEFKNLFAAISNMDIMSKIKLALKGNKEARSILVRDANKLVSTAVLKSPKINDNEVVAIAGSKNVSDQILRQIHRKKEWRKIYLVQVGLASNPKTPFDIAMGMLKMLRSNDLRAISRSKQVPNAVATTAKRMLASKQK